MHKANNSSCLYTLRYDAIMSVVLVINHYVNHVIRHLECNCFDMYAKLILFDLVLYIQN